MKKLTTLVDIVLARLTKLDSRDVLIFVALSAVTAMGLYALYIVGMTV